MNAQQLCVFNDDLVEYDPLDNIALSDLMKACRQNSREGRFHSKS